MFSKNSCPLQKQTHDFLFSFFSFAAVMIHWLKKRANKFPRRISAEFLSDWLELLIPYS